MCLKCKRLWPQGSKWCGNCQATLGRRYCPEDHENALGTDCCTTCGYRKLTAAVPCLNLRPLVWLVAIVGATLVGPGLLQALRGLTSHLFWLLFAPLERLLITLSIISFFLAPVLGERGRLILRSALQGLFSFTFEVLREIAKQLLRWMTSGTKSLKR